MSTPKFTAPETPVTREEVYYDAILRGLNGDSPAPVIPTPVWRMEEYLAAIAEAASSGGGGGSNKFIVTLTPTAADYSGTMDHTVAEINAAYEAGQEIWFRVITSASSYTDAPLTSVYKDDNTYPSFNAYVIDSAMSVILFAGTVTTNDGTKQTYSTTVYALTPAS